MYPSGISKERFGGLSYFIADGHNRTSLYCPSGHGDMSFRNDKYVCPTCGFRVRSIVNVLDTMRGKLDRLLKDLKDYNKLKKDDVHPDYDTIWPSSNQNISTWGDVNSSEITYNTFESVGGNISFKLNSRH